MRIAVLFLVLITGACSVEKVTDRNSGVGIAVGDLPENETTPVQGETDYRGKLMSEING